MPHRAIQNVVDTISQKPEVGIVSSMVGAALSPVEIISLVSAILGLIVTIITLLIKFMDIKMKIEDKKLKRTNKGVATVLKDSEEVIIDGKRYKLTEPEES